MANREAVREGETSLDRCLALIPARGLSKRVPGKNIRLLAGKPLIAYSIAAAQQSGQFNKVLVSSDDPRTLEIAASYGADVLQRPAELATAESPDIEWVRHALRSLAGDGKFTTFSILRPTSPFRTADTIRRAFADWRRIGVGGYTSLRAVEPVSQHPAKMWRIHANELVPLLPQPYPQPWHDSQHTTLPVVYVQNASLEIAHVRTVEQTDTISGGRVLPFVTSGIEGFDINTEADWSAAERVIANRRAKLTGFTEPCETHDHQPTRP